MPGFIVDRDKSRRYGPFGPSAGAGIKNA